MRSRVLVSVSLFFLLPLGCATNPPRPQEPESPAQAVQSGPPAAEQPAAAAPPAGQPAPPPPTTQGGQAAPLVPGAAASAMPILQGLGRSEAPGAAPYGGAFAGQFQEGQVLEQPINIQPGKCYTIVAAGTGVQVVGVRLVLQPAPTFPPLVVAQSQEAGPTAVVGGRATGCWRNALPIGGPGKVVLQAEKGAGLIAGQVYVK